MRKSVLLTVLVCLTAACSATPPGEEFGMKDQSAIRDRTAGFVKAFNGKDVPQLLGIYTENSVFMPPNQPIIRGRDALKTFYDELFAAGATNLKMDVTEVSGHGPLAYESGTYEMDVKPKPGAGVEHDRGKYLFILRRMNNTWRLEYTVWNSDFPVTGH